MDSALLEIYYNTESLDPNKFGAESIQKLSKVKVIQFTSNEPQFIGAKMHVDLVSDETDYFQFGQEKENSYSYISFGALEKSWFTKYPSYYKFLSVDL